MEGGKGSLVWLSLIGKVVEKSGKRRDGDAVDQVDEVG